MIHDRLTVTGYYPGSIGRVVETHAVYYHEHWGFDVSFESQVARELGEFMGRFDAGKDGFWTVGDKNRFLGAIAIDGANVDNEGARLRWFIVSTDCQGKGIGKILIDEALEFCRTVGHRKVHLWTFRGLDPARRLYENAGFTLDQEHEITQWGGRIIEQKFVLTM
jgi:GNAT superfamily N-acetyltransferase